MKPTLSKSRIDAKALSFEKPSKIGLKGGGCPSGTVPIKRVTKEDLIRHQHMQDMKKNLNDHVSSHIIFIMPYRFFIEFII